jgi:hypothetical protein
MLTRDSAVLWLGIIGGVLTALAAQGEIFPVSWRPYITMVSTIIAVISGKLATSPLPGAPKDDVVSLPK